MSTATTSTDFVPATNPSLADLLLDRLVALRPTRKEAVETRVGISEATYAQVVEVAEEGPPVDHGELPVFWTVVRRQLDQATAEAPWVAGRLVKVGNAYRLDTPTPVEQDRVAGALAALVEAPE